MDRNIANPSPADMNCVMVWDCATSRAISEKPPRRQN